MMKAFSFIEILIAITIAATVFISVFSLAIQNITAAALTRDRMIASHLAQEGVEVVINKRSNNWLTFPSDLSRWRDGLADGSNYIAQYNSPSLSVDATNPALVIDADTSLYCYPSLDATCSGTLSPFRRQIAITTINDHQFKVVVTVSWLYNNQTRSMSVEERLYNWR